MSSLQTVALGLAIVFVDVGSGGWDWLADPVGWVLVLMGLSPLKELLPGYPGTAIGGWVCLLVSVLIFPPGSVDTIDASLGWLFTIPALGFCFLLCDGLADVTSGSVALRFRALRLAFVVVAVLPFFVYLVGWEWLSIPATAMLWASEAVLVLTVWAAGDEGDDEETGFSAERIRRRQASGTRPEPPREVPHRKRSAAASPTSTPQARTSVTRAAEPDGEDEERTWWGGRKKQEEGFSAEAVRERLRREREERAARERQDAEDD